MALYQPRPSGHRKENLAGTESQPCSLITWNCNSWGGKLRVRAAPAQRRHVQSEDRVENKTALAPPAVRAPVFPHAHPVTTGVKSAILPAVRKRASVRSIIRMPYLRVENVIPL